MDFKILGALGVSEKAAALYLAGLALGTATVQELAQKSGIKRPTAYLYLGELVAQGLCERIVLGKKAGYRAVNPSVVEAQIAENLRIVQRSLPALHTFGKRDGEGSEIRLLDTWKALEEFCSKILAAEENACLYAGFKDLEGMRGAVHALIANLIRERGVKTREIVPHTKESRQCARKRAKAYGSSYTWRTGLAALKDMTVLSDRGVVFLRVTDRDFSAIGILDAHMAEDQKALFEMAWDSARAQRLPGQTATAT